MLERYLETQWWSLERQQEYQLSQIQSLLRYAYKHVKYYRRTWNENGVDPRDIRTLDDFYRLPIVTKSDIQRHGPDFLSDAPPFYARKVQTGGSTGRPLVLWRDSNCTNRAWALYLRLWLWTGYSPGDAYADLYSMPVVRRSFHKQQYTKLMMRAKNEYKFDAHKMDRAKAVGFLRRIAEIDPVFLRGYVSALESLAQTQVRENLPISVGAVTTVAETLLPAHRTAIEDAFGCSVFEQYGGGECQSMAYECEQHSGLHICAEHCLLEIVDPRGEPVAADQVGEVVVTDLDNLAMPIIRYKNEDLARSSSEKCPCGRGLPLIKDVLGRVSDMIHGADGQEVYGEFFTNVLKQTDWLTRFGVTQFQVVQAADSSVRWRVVSEIEPGEPDINELITYTVNYLGNLPVSVELVDQIPLTQAGKRRFTISELAQR